MIWGISFFLIKEANDVIQNECPSLGYLADKHMGRFGHGRMLVCCISTQNREGTVAEAWNLAVGLLSPNESSLYFYTVFLGFL